MNSRTASPDPPSIELYLCGQVRFRTVDGRIAMLQPRRLECLYAAARFDRRLRGGARPPSKDLLVTRLYGGDLGGSRSIDYVAQRVRQQLQVPAHLIDTTSVWVDANWAEDALQVARRATIAGAVGPAVALLLRILRTVNQPYLDGIEGTGLVLDWVDERRAALADLRDEVEADLWDVVESTGSSLAPSVHPQSDSSSAPLSANQMAFLDDFVSSIVRLDQWTAAGSTALSTIDRASIEFVMNMASILGLEFEELDQGLLLSGQLAPLQHVVDTVRIRATLWNGDEAPRFAVALGDASFRFLASAAREGVTDITLVAPEGYAVGVWDERAVKTQDQMWRSIASAPQPRAVAPWASGDGPADHFVGRENELALMRSADTGAHRAPRLLVLEGEGGVGKTELIRQFLSKLPTGRCVLYGSASPAGAQSEPLYDAVRDLLGRVDSQLAWAAVGSRLGGLLSLLEPRLAQKFKVPGLRQMSDPSQQTIFSGLLDLLEGFSFAGPTVLVLDNLHWAEPSSLRNRPALKSFWNAVFDPGRHSLTRLRAFVVCLQRPTDHSGYLDLIKECAVSAGTEISTANLNPLDREAVRELVRLHDPAVVRPDWWIERLWRETRGLPARLRLTLMTDGGSAARGSVVDFPDLATRYALELTRAAIYARESPDQLGNFTLEEFAAITGHSAASVEQVLEEGHRIGALAIGPDLHVRFQSDYALLRFAEAEVGALERRRAHRQALIVLQSFHADEGEHASAMSAHAAEVGDSETTGRSALAAARFLSTRAEWSAAAALAERAIAFGRVAEWSPADTAEAHNLAGEALLACGRDDEAHQAFRQAIRLAVEARNGSQAARAAVGVASPLLNRGLDAALLADLIEDALTVVDEASMRHTLTGRLRLERINARERELAARESHAELISFLVRVGSELDEELRDSRAELERPSEVAWLTMARLGLLLFDDDLELRQRLVDLLRRVAARMVPVQWGRDLGAWADGLDFAIALGAGDTSMADAALARLDVAAGENDRGYVRWAARSSRAVLLLDRGDVDSANWHRRLALSAWATDVPQIAVLHKFAQAPVGARATGRFAEFDGFTDLAQLGNAVAAYALINEGRRPRILNCAAVALLAIAGEHSAARDHLDAISGGDVATAEMEPGTHRAAALALLGEAAFHLASPELAAAVVARLEPIANVHWRASLRWRNITVGFAAVSLGPAARYLGLCHAALMEERVARAYFLAALTHARLMRAKLWEVRTLVDWSRAEGAVDMDLAVRLRRRAVRQARKLRHEGAEVEANEPPSGGA